MFLGSASGIANGNPATAAAQLESNQADAQLGRQRGGRGRRERRRLRRRDRRRARLRTRRRTRRGRRVRVPRQRARASRTASPRTAAAQLESNQADARTSARASAARRRERRRLRRRDRRRRRATTRGQAVRGRRVRLPRAARTGSRRRTRGTAHDAARVGPGERAASASASPGAGDVNGDGYADVIVGAPRLRRGPDERGRRVRVPRQRVGDRRRQSRRPPRRSSSRTRRRRSFGVERRRRRRRERRRLRRRDRRRTGATTRASPNEGAAFVFLGSASGHRGRRSRRRPRRGSSRIRRTPHFGISVAGAGDVNGDGYADVIVGRRLLRRTARTDEGARVRVPRQRVGDRGRRLRRPPPTQLESNQEYTRTLGAASVAGAGDVNGDGYADVIVGAARLRRWASVSRAPHSCSTAARRGSATATPRTPRHRWTRHPSQANAYFGSSVAGQAT